MTYLGVMSETLVKVLFRIPEDDRRALKILAAERDTSSTELVRRLIRQYVSENSARKGV